MRRFRFSLETVLRVRRQTEEVRKRELAAAQAARDGALTALGGLEDGVRRLLREQSEARAKAVDLAEEAWFRARWAGLTQAVAAARLDLAKKEETLGARRAEAVEASRERLVLERLEERQRQEHLFQLNREEQGLLDDLAQRSVSALAFPAR